MKDFELLHVGLNSPKKAWHIGRHSHAYHEIVVVMWSKEKISIDKKFVEASEGDVLVFRPGVGHEEWSGDNPPLETIFFTFNMKNLPAEIPLKIQDSKGRLRIVATWMLNESRTLHSSESSPLLNSYLGAFIAEMMRIIKHQDSPLVESIRSMIIREPAKEHSLESLAKSAGLSKYHFLRKYRKLSGSSPADDVRRIRLSLAKDLLISTDEPLKHISEKTGLGNEASLCRVFRKYLKQSPGSFRKQ
ncbi:MAG TPA: hypothetical protein DCZ94_10375 [Lentisphaeria bacterium]|nr:MAG: hypothetical protein A2X48_23905 [Lentisphaerae bacterium GWF2_49_21]HBC87349.1 hypothetical protein [Lentisphaeria bacterium]